MNSPTVIVKKFEKKINLKKKLFILTLNIEKKIIYFLRFCLCIFESDTVKSDCPVQIIRKMIKYLKIYYKLLVYLTSFTVVFFGDIKKIYKKL